MNPDGSNPAGIRRFIPILGWIGSYDRRWLRGDVLAGIAVAALVIPKNLGYAGIAGIPLQNGLYAAAAGAIIYAVFGTSRQISTGPSSSLAAVAASAVLAAGLVGTQDAAALVATITVVSGVLFLVLAALRMGWIASFLSRAVVTSRTVVRVRRTLDLAWRSEPVGTWRPALGASRVRAVQPGAAGAELPYPPSRCRQ
jgi:sulfate permease, SulP family